MELIDFLQELQSDVREQVSERLESSGAPYPYNELVFAEIVMNYMAEIGMAFEPRVCHFETTIGNAKLRLSGYAFGEDDAEQIDLFVSLYGGVEQIVSVPDADTKKAAEQCLRFVTLCSEGKLSKTLDPSQEIYDLATQLERSFDRLDQIRVYVITDRVAKAKSFKPRAVQGKTIKLEVMDIERLHRHWSQGKPRDELVVDFTQVSGSALPCVYIPGDGAGYEFALSIVPGEALRFIYERYGARLLEANVRSFLSTAGKINKGIRDTLTREPERFMAYNNGIVIVADEARFGRTQEGGPGLLWLRGMQIVNGGQTTASLYFTKKKDSRVDLSRVRIPAKIIVLSPQHGGAASETFIADISHYANSQNVVRQSDLSANSAFHVALESLALSTYCPDGVGRWFYERATGSYSTMLAREGTTSAKLRQLRTAVVPSSRKITKTDLAKYLNAWGQRPDVVSLGAQKNFQFFMGSICHGESEDLLPDVNSYKAIVAKAIIFKKAVALVRPLFPAFQGNVATYLVSLLANRLGDRIDLERVWNRQEISDALQEQVKTWAPEVHARMSESSGGRMLSEWAKKGECWAIVRDGDYSKPRDGIPELR